MQNPAKKMIDCAHQPVGVQERGRVKKLGTSVEVRVCALILFFALIPMRSAAQTNSETVEKGSFKLHMLLHAVGEETYEVKRAGSDELVMSVSSELTDRSNKRSIAATLRMKTDLTPSGFEQDRGGVCVRHGYCSRRRNQPRDNSSGEIFCGIRRESGFRSNDDGALLVQPRKTRGIGNFTCDSRRA